MKPEEVKKKLLASIMPDNQEQREFDAAVLSAIEKQIPRRPLIILHTNRIQSEQEVTYCPCCEHIFGIRPEHNYCWYCGQCIDWTEEK